MKMDDMLPVILILGVVGVVFFAMKAAPATPATSPAAQAGAAITSALLTKLVSSATSDDDGGD
jgi:hypothetical protein